MTIEVRDPESIHQEYGEIQNGTFHGRWHFSFGDYFDRKHMQFGTLRVFNDDTLSPGAVWPLHPHKNNEVVTYCVEGEFKHADERGEGGILEKGWVQHTTVGKGMWHSEINNRPDAPMRFVQMWFLPLVDDLDPSVEQMKVDKADRTDRFLPLVSNVHHNALKINSDARVFSCLLSPGRKASQKFDPGRGGYLCVLEGDGVAVNGKSVELYGAAAISDEQEGEVEAKVEAKEGSELLLVDVPLQQSAY
jgi:quercetin 2,3-dioxygenase